MVLSKRERYIVYGTLVALAILLLDRFVLTPVEARKKVVEEQTSQRTVEDVRAKRLKAQEKELEPKWRAMLEAGLSAKPADAESQVLHAVRNWSQEAGLSLSSLRPERGTERDQLLEMTFSASGTGSMNAVAGFLWRLESAAMPIRITEIQLGTRKEGTDDLSLQLRISALCQTAGAEPTPRKTPAPIPSPTAPAPTATETPAPTPTETATPTPSPAPAPDTAPASEATAETDAPPDENTTPAPQTTPTPETTPVPDAAPAPQETPAPPPTRDATLTVDEGEIDE